MKKNPLNECWHCGGVLKEVTLGDREEIAHVQLCRKCGRMYEGGDCLNNQ